jgi:hypothetical protein
VHRELRELFVARSSLEVEARVTSRMLSVYGRFEAADGSVITADITGHRYLAYRVAVTSGSPAVTIPPNSGRLIAAGAGAGTVEVEVKVDPALNQPAAPVKVDVTVAPEVTDRPILDRFHTGTNIRKKSILFLPDGFTRSQKTEFQTLAHDVGETLLRSLSPYHHLRESFDLYTAFVESAEEGVTIGPPILALPGATDRGVSVPMDQPLQAGAWELRHLLLGLGHPSSTSVSIADAAAGLRRFFPRVNTNTLPEELFNLWKSLRTWPPQSRVRETYFGIMLGDRYHGPAALPEPLPIPQPPRWPPSVEASIHLERSGVRTPMFDERRLPELVIDPKLAQATMLERFVKTLRVPGESSALGEIWMRPSEASVMQGDSYGLVVIIARADHYGGVRTDDCVLLSLGQGVLHDITPSTVVPELLEVVPVPRPIRDRDKARGFGERPLDSLMDVIAHELAHTTALGHLHDEYSDTNKTSGPDLAVAAAVEFIEARPNTQLLANAAAPGSHKLIPAQIKWNWDRATGAARVEQIRVAGSDIEIGVTTEDMVRWPHLRPGQALTLRSGNLATPAPGSAHVGTLTAPSEPAPLAFVSIDRATQLLRCSPSGATPPGHVVARFPPGSVLVIPRVSLTGRRLRLIPERLEIELAQRGPFSPSSAMCEPADSQMPRIVADFRWPRNRLDAIAAYESGGAFPCGVIRPAGRCKMRTAASPLDTPVEFCHVCKYAMVSLLDPALLGAIDSEYPR